MYLLMKSEKGKHKVLMRIYAVRYKQILIGIMDCEARRVQSCVESPYEKQMWLWFYNLHVIWTACAQLDPKFEWKQLYG